MVEEEVFLMKPTNLPKQVPVKRAKKIKSEKTASEASVEAINTKNARKPFINDKESLDNAKAFVNKMKKEQEERKKIKRQKEEAIMKKLDVDKDLAYNKILEAREKRLIEEREKKMAEMESKKIERKIKEAERISEVRENARKRINEDEYLHKKLEKEFLIEQEKEKILKETEEFERRRELYYVPVSDAISEHQKKLKQYVI